jgi:hypothetical protein
MAIFPAAPSSFCYSASGAGTTGESTVRIFLALFIFLLFRPGFAAPGSRADDAATSLMVEASEPVSSDLSGQDDLEPCALAGKRAGMPFTKKGKTTVKQKNAEQNDGKNRCESCGVDTVPGQQHKKGVTPGRLHHNPLK